MILTIFKILLVVISFQLLFISFFLFQNKKGKRYSNHFLAVVFLMLGLSLITLGLSASGVFIDNPILVSIDDSFMLAYGPLLFLFTRSVLIKDFKLQKKQLVHFIPFLALTLLIITVISISEVLEGNFNIMYVAVFETILMLHIATYVIKCRLEIKNALSTATANYSNIPIEHISWLKLIINSFVIILITTIIHATIPFLQFKYGLLISLALFIIYLFYFVNKVILRMLNNATKDSGIIMLVEQGNQDKYKGSNLTDVQLKSYVSKISAYFDKHQPFLESNITLQHLAEIIEISPKALSQVINAGFSLSFFDFINTYRIEHAIKLLNQNTAKTTIQEVMYDSGFSSKSSFNTAFKKFTGLTPTNYKLQQKKGSTS
ncbi:MAG: AraC family transcriptional regulator [Flavobacteriaceae bacterium]